MDADTLQDSPVPGYSIPIRAPLTLDSDSDFSLSVNNHIYSRTSSFNSTSSSIDVSSYGDEHTSILEQESSDLVACSDQEIVIARSCVEESMFIRPFVRYPDDKTSFRSFVKIPCEESSSIDVSSYGDEHISILEEESSDFVAYPDEESVIERSCLKESLFVRPFVRYPDGDVVKDGCGFSDIINFRPSVKVSCEEIGSGGFGPVGVKLSVPIAPLTGDDDSDSDSVGGGRWDDGIVQKVTMGPKVRSFSGDEGDDEVQVEGVFSGDDIKEIENFDSVSTETVENEGCKVECLSEEVKVYGSDVSSFDLERVNEIEYLSSVSTEMIVNEGCKVGYLNEVVKLAKSEASGFDLKRIEAQIVSNSDSEIESLSYVSTESVDNKVCKVKCLNEVVKLSVSDASSFDLEGIDALTVSSSNNEIEIERKLSEAEELSFDSEVIDAQIVSSADSEIQNLNYVSTEAKLSEADVLRFLERIDKQIETIKEKLSELDEPTFDSEQIDAQTAYNSDSEIEHLSSVSTESIANEQCKVEHLTEDLKLSESDASSHHLERIEVQTASSSNNEIEIETINMNHSEPDDQDVSSSDSEIEIKTINESKQEIVSNNEKPLKKMQQIRTKFLRLALNEQLTTKVNGEGGNYKFDFSLTILAIGKTGVGKSATINSIFGENKAVTNAFDHSTTTIQEITGNVDGIQLRVIDTPGLKSSYLDRPYNLRILKSIKRFTRKHTPNVVLYVDRLDTLDVNDALLLKLITSSLGSSVWHSCIIALTHAGCDPLDEPSKEFVVQRCRFLQEQIVSFGDNNRIVANPVWLVDNHPCYTHDVMDLNCDLKGLACLDQADEDDGCDKVQPCEPLSEPRNVINSSRERRDAHSKESAYRVKLVVDNHGFGLTWS